MGKKSKNIRSTQTKVKHQILEAYLERWMGIIFWGIKKSPVTIVQRPHFVYVDAFSYTGKYPEGDIDNPNSGPVYGSPVIGIQQLDQFAQYARKENFPIRRNVILLEKDTDTYRNLLSTLDEIGVGDRVRETTDFHSLHDGEIAVANVDATEMGQVLTDYTDQNYTWAFYLLDPYGGSGIPYDFVRQIVSGPHHDVMINFIYLAFLRDLALVLKPDEELSPAEKKKISLWSNVYGENEWTGVYVDYQFNIDTTYGRGMSKDEATRIAASRYADVLQSMDQDITVKTIALQFPDRDRIMLYLFLTTHDPTGALAMNEVLYKANLLEQEIRQKVRLEKRIRDSGQAMLPGLAKAFMEEQIDKTPRPDVVEIEEELISRFSGKRINLRTIYRGLVDTDFFPSEIKKALQRLRKKKIVDYPGKLTNRTYITFSAEK